MPRKLDSRFQSTRGRSTRRPEHRFYCETYPWEIQVCAIAPVLPGESLRRAVWQSRIVSDPLTSPTIGWWQDYFVFYVPMSLLASGATFKALVEAGDLNTPLAATGADVAAYYAGRGMNWVRQCSDVIVQQWFRQEDEMAGAPAPFVRSGRPAARLGIDGIEHSLRMGANYPDGGALGSTQRAQEDLLRTYEFLRDQNLIQMTYEDWLRSYGVSAPEAIRQRRPFLLRYVRNWTYPVNTVNQADGLPKTAVSWAITERADKRRDFQEPGFIVLVSCTRPKVYRSNQEAHGASAMDRLRYWLPAFLRDDALTSYRDDTGTSSPLYDTVLADPHYVDVRDLLTHGDQFVCQSFASTRDNSIALPDATGEAQYATQAMAESLFANPGAAGLFFIRQDGVMRLEISSAVEDTQDATAST